MVTQCLTTGNDSLEKGTDTYFSEANSKNSVSLLKLRGKVNDICCGEVEQGPNGYPCNPANERLSGMRVEQTRRLKELEKESGRIKRLVVDLTLENAILKEAPLGYSCAL